MKKLLLGVIVFIPFLSCVKDKTLGGTTHPDPVPVPVAGKINSFIASSNTINYTGVVPNPGVVNFSWNTSNGSTLFNGAAVGSVDNKNVGPLYPGDNTFPLDVMAPGGNAHDSRTVNVTVDPMFSKLAGTTAAGRSFDMITSTRQPIGGGPVYDLMTQCLRDDVFTFFLNGTNQTNYGTDTSCATGLSNVYSYSFDASNPNNMLLKLLNVIPAQPDRKVEFPTPTTMTQSYDYNGYHYVQGFKVH